MRGRARNCGHEIDQLAPRILRVAVLVCIHAAVVRLLAVSPVGFAARHLNGDAGVDTEKLADARKQIRTGVQMVNMQSLKTMGARKGGRTGVGSGAVQTCLRMHVCVAGVRHDSVGVAWGPVPPR